MNNLLGITRVQLKAPNFFKFSMNDSPKSSSGCSGLASCPIISPVTVRSHYYTFGKLIKVTENRLDTLDSCNDNEVKNRLDKRVIDLERIRDFAEKNNFAILQVNGWIENTQSRKPGQSQIDSIVLFNAENRKKIEIKLRSTIEFQEKKGLFDDVALSSDRPVRSTADLSSLSHFGFIVEGGTKRIASKIYFNGFNYIFSNRQIKGGFEQIKSKVVEPKKKAELRGVNNELKDLVNRLHNPIEREIMNKLDYIRLLSHGKISGLGAPTVFDKTSSVWTMLPSYWPAFQQEFLNINLNSKDTPITSKLMSIFPGETIDDKNDHLLIALKLLSHNFNSSEEPLFFKSMDVENLLGENKISIERQVKILKDAINVIEEPSSSMSIEKHEEAWLIMAVKHMSVFMDQIDLCCPSCKGVDEKDEQIFPQPISNTRILDLSLNACDDRMNAKSYLSEQVIPQLKKVADSVYSAFGVESSGFKEDITSWSNFFLDGEFTTYSDDDDSENIEMYAKMIKLIMNRIVAIDDYYLSDDLKSQRDCLLDCLNKVSHVFLEKLNLDEGVVSKRCYVYAQLISDVEHIDFGLKSEVNFIEHPKKNELYKKAKDLSSNSEIREYAENYEPTNKPKKVGMQEKANFLTVFGAVKPLYQIGFLGKLGNGKSTMVNRMLDDSSLWPSNKGVAVMHNNDTAGTTQEDNDETDHLFESITLTIKRDSSLIQSEPNKNLDPLGLRTFSEKEMFKKRLFYSEIDKPTFEREETPEGCLCCKSQEIKTAQDTTWDSGYDDPPDILVVDPVGIAGSEILSQQDVYSRTASIGLATMENLMSRDWDSLLDMENFNDFLSRLPDDKEGRKAHFRTVSRSSFIDVLIEHCSTTNIIFFNNHFDGRSESQLDVETLDKRRQNYKALVTKLKNEDGSTTYIEGMDKEAHQNLVDSLLFPVKDIKGNVSEVKEGIDHGVKEKKDGSVVEHVPAFKMPYPEENPTEGELPAEFTQVCKVFNGINLNNPNWYDLKYFLDQGQEFSTQEERAGYRNSLKGLFQTKDSPHWIALVDTIFDSYDPGSQTFLFNNVGFKHTAPNSKHVVDFDDFSKIVELIKDTEYFQDKFAQLKSEIRPEDFVGYLKRDAKCSIQSAPNLTQEKLKALFKYQEEREKNDLDRLKADVYVNGYWYRVHASSSQRLVFTKWNFDNKRKELSGEKFFLEKNGSEYELQPIA